MMSTKALKQLQKSTIKSKRRMKLKYGCSMSKPQTRDHSNKV